MKRYFAYGSNMNQGDLDRWCQRRRYPKIRFQTWQRAVLHGFKLDFTHFSVERKGGTADVVSCPGEFVEGILFSVSDDVMEFLDRKEGAKEGIYRQIPVPVRLEGGEEVKAVTYQVCNPEPFQPPHKCYLETIIDGAKAYGLSEEWIHRLERTPVRGSSFAEAEP